MNEPRLKPPIRLSFEEAVEKCLTQYDSVFRELARIEAEERRAGEEVGKAEG